MNGLLGKNRRKKFFWKSMNSEDFGLTFVANKNIPNSLAKPGE